MGRYDESNDALMEPVIKALHKDHKDNPHCGKVIRSEWIGKANQEAQKFI